MDSKHLSKKMSYVLRHRPESVGITLDKSGWVAIDTLAFALNVSVNDINTVIKENDKQRFAFSVRTNGIYVRAQQGHSIPIDLELKKAMPPQYLYHGTKEKFLNSIMKEGLTKQNRHDVHLTNDIVLASLTANRRSGRSAMLFVKANEMYWKGHKFYKTNNNVWLTDYVPVEFIIAQTIREEEP